MQLKPINDGYEAYSRFKSGEDIYTKIFGVDPILCKHDHYSLDDFTSGHFTFYEGVEHTKISAKEFIEKSSKEDILYFLSKEKYAVFGWLELKTSDGKVFEININELKELMGTSVN